MKSKRPLPGPFLLRYDLKVSLKIGYFPEVEAGWVKSRAYMAICEHFYFHPNEEIRKKNNF
ncbi:MAG: hypothetical protein A2052_01890 [Deltaproteobacteria bacterium GWA2_54_12]|nr:MAG: hypothetical protein A2052_01890 [Deltaproteobacteria bacterium GWA2_54_12]